MEKDSRGVKFVFDTVVAIPFYRDPAHKEVSLKTILAALDANWEKVGKIPKLLKSRTYDFSCDMALYPKTVHGICRYAYFRISIV